MIEKANILPINHKITRMTTFIKTKFNKSDEKTNIDNIELRLVLNSIK